LPSYVGHVQNDLSRLTRWVFFACSFWVFLKKTMNYSNNKNKRLNLQARNERKSESSVGGGERKGKKKRIASFRAMPHWRSTC